MKPALVCVLALTFMLSACSRDSEKTGRVDVRLPAAPCAPLAVTTSDYEEREPLITEKVKVIAVNAQFQRVVFQDPANPQNSHELITGTGANAEKVCAYFHYIPNSILARTERDREILRWGLIFGKYALLANIPVQSLRGDTLLMKQCKDASDGFYLPLHYKMAPEGIDIRDVHLILKPLKASKSVLIGVSSQEWDAIRRAVMHGHEHDLYTLFP
jgi:hypothetical protein